MRVYLIHHLQDAFTVNFRHTINIECKSINLKIVQSEILIETNDISSQARRKDEGGCYWCSNTSLNSVVRNNFLCSHII